LNVGKGSTLALARCGGNFRTWRLFDVGALAAEEQREVRRIHDVLRVGLRRKKFRVVGEAVLTALGLEMPAMLLGRADEVIE
jgi:hypothetical protein